MLDNPYLDTIICIVLVFALLSILVSLIVEWWNAKIKQRGVFLQTIVRRILRDDLNHDYGYRIYQHPTINRMRRDENSYPYYISAEAFSTALIDTIAEDAAKDRYVLAEDGKTATRVNPSMNDPLGVRFVAGVMSMNESPMKRLFLNFIDRNGGRQKGEFDVHGLKAELGRWFDDHMDRASGEYKLKLKPKLMGIGMLVAIVLNVDSIHLMKVFMLDEPLRNSTVAAAEAAAGSWSATEGLPDTVRYRAIMDTLATMPDGNTVRTGGKDTMDLTVVRRIVSADNSTAGRDAVEVLDRLNRLKLPMGWDRADAPLSWFTGPEAMAGKTNNPTEAALLQYFDERNEPGLKQCFLWIVGILITGFSLSQGAPFWFATLLKLVNIRRAGVKPKSTTNAE